MLDKFLVKLFKISAIKKYWSRNYKVLEFNNIPWTKLVKPLKKCKIVLVTTGGIHLKSDKEFDLIDPPPPKEPVRASIRACEMCRGYAFQDLQLKGCFLSP